ncbi:unnamed protein product [Vitrella brassicaformis CCMP3155]|uniref:3-oxoacyl-[acyl-carrier-protein] reductase n=1 Tax=Vitrella brassicaformis (strain CCMP3155) TaxID=1169540 RepID=A0A0G4G7W1_VITBC|nr:unnamed protein product [Vitrella brassicaformis CCMP3155]|mmetsp:Transcript_16989/g.40773  ORF Transcript_16989/g.40773 Transcript_16989/m.40773 type:complete len:288 (-) Transcript_16989:439-1302(-)|eukprot:CEM24497.1 unnamed protein product [Vitrella brassicaformis CCMP3155]
MRRDDYGTMSANGAAKSLLSLRGKRAVITGSTAGIGLGIAEALCDHGCRVVISGSRPREAAEAVVATLKKDFPAAELHYIQADLSTPEGPPALIKQTIETLGGLDIVVNNAGLQHTSPLVDFPLDKWQQLMALHLTAPFLTMQSALRHWRDLSAEQKTSVYGRLINISSAHGLVASPNKTAYCAAKHGVLGLTKAAALEMAETGVTVNAVCPGWVNTDLVHKQVVRLSQDKGISIEEAETKLVSAKHPNKMFTPARHVGEYVAFLCSEAATCITGASQVIDGGWTIQ